MYVLSLRRAPKKNMGSYAVKWVNLSLFDYFIHRDLIFEYRSIYGQYITNTQTTYL